MILPPKELRKCGNFFLRDDYWVGSAMREAERLRDYHGMGPTSTILDVGCGVGRLPIGLRETNFAFGRYHGVDVDSKAIDWCRANLEVTGKRVFHLVDVRNERYNPQGSVLMDGSFRLPFEPKTFSIIYSWSLFTHLRLGDARTYLSEFKRLLTDKGSVFMTAFCEPDVESEKENPPGYPPGKSDQGPLHRVRFSEESLGQAIKDAGLRVVRHNRHSEWNMQTTFMLKHAESKKGCCG